MASIQQNMVSRVNPALCNILIKYSSFYRTHPCPDHDQDPQGDPTRAPDRDLDHPGERDLTPDHYQGPQNQQSVAALTVHLQITTKLQTLLSDDNVDERLLFRKKQSHLAKTMHMNQTFSIFKLSNYFTNSLCQIKY